MTACQMTNVKRPKLLVCHFSPEIIITFDLPDLYMQLSMPHTQHGPHFRTPVIRKRLTWLLKQKGMHELASSIQVFYNLERKDQQRHFFKMTTCGSFDP